MWKEELRNSVRSVAELADMGLVQARDVAALSGVTEDFPLLIPRYYLSLIDKSDPVDPIRKMCIPSAMELDVSGEFDTSGEKDNTVVQGLQHKYKNTALMLSTNLCAMYCRHCFRKRLVGTSEDETVSMMEGVTEYVSQHEEIDNVLISGGDALMNSNRVLERILEPLSQLPNIKFIRLGTRMPVVLPSRINDDDELMGLLSGYAAKKRIFLVTQFNHPKELTKQARQAVKRLNSANIIVNNQSVLLKGVNDTEATLAELMNRLTQSGVIPYYVFQCRPVAAVKAQFQIPFVEAIDIVEGAKLHLSGIAKRFKYAMSHPTGKIEIVGKVQDSTMVFKYHQPKYEKDAGRVFAVNVTPTQCWLDDID